LDLNRLWLESGLPMPRKPLESHALFRRTEPEGYEEGAFPDHRSLNSGIITGVGLHIVATNTVNDILLLSVKASFNSTP